MDKAILGDLLRRQLAANPDLLLVINADDGVEHGHVVEVMDIARGANVAKMAIAVQPKESRRCHQNEEYNCALPETAN